MPIVFRPAITAHIQAILGTMPRPTPYVPWWQMPTRDLTDALVRLTDDWLAFTEHLGYRTRAKKRDDDWL